MSRRLAVHLECESSNMQNSDAAALESTTPLITPLNGLTALVRKRSFPHLFRVVPSMRTSTRAACY